MLGSRKVGILKQVSVITCWFISIMICPLQFLILWSLSSYACSFLLRLHTLLLLSKYAYVRYNYPSAMKFFPISSFSFSAIKRAPQVFENLEVPICYFPNGDIAWNNYACDLSTPVSHCCGVSMICLNNQICRSDMGNNIRGACTDQTWKSSDCPQYCLGKWRNLLFSLSVFSLFSLRSEISKPFF